MLDVIVKILSNSGNFRQVKKSQWFFLFFVNNTEAQKLHVFVKKFAEKNQ
jgi:hypothetical protein